MELNFTIEVPPDKTLVERLQACRLESIPDNFRQHNYQSVIAPGGYRAGLLLGGAAAELETLSLHKFVHSKGMVSANIWQLLAFAERNPQAVPYGRRVVALGTSYQYPDGNHYSPAIIGLTMALYLFEAPRFGNQWRADDLFLVCQSLQRPYIVA